MKKLVLMMLVLLLSYGCRTAPAPNKEMPPAAPTAQAAPEPEPAPPAPATPEEQRVQALKADLEKSGGEDAIARYRLARALTAAGRKDEALAELDKAMDCGWLGSDLPKGDAELAALKGEKKFQEILDKVQAAEKAIAGRITKNVSKAGVPYVLFLPEGVGKGQADRKYPVILSIDPGGDGSWGVNFWKGFAYKHRYILVGVTNGMRSIPLREVFETYPVDRKKMFVEGFSAGGAAALQIGVPNPEIFAGIITFGCGGIGGALEASAMPQIRPDSEKIGVYMVAGTADPGHLQQSKIHKKRLEEKGFKVILKEMEGVGHGRPPQAMPDLIRWLDQQENPLVDSDGRVIGTGAEKPAGR